MPIEVDKANKETAIILKKIRASNGKLQGNFYFVGKADGSEGGLVLTLAAKDKKGQKAKGIGKKLRNEIKGAKFALGLVQMIEGKLVFILHGGTASKAHIKGCFKKTLSTLAGLKFLMKAVFKTPENQDVDEVSVEESPVENVDELDDADLDDVDLDELKQLEEEQAEIADLSSEIAEFLSHDTEVSEYEEQLQKEVADLERLKSGDASAEDIHEARTALSKTMDIGKSLHISQENPLPDGLTDLLNLTARNMYETYLKDFKPVIDTVIFDAIDFGGVQVQSLFKKAEEAAESAEYSLAVQEITKAYQMAQKVLARLPFVLAFKEHSPRIDAATNIKVAAGDKKNLFTGSAGDETSTFGSEVKREWEEVQKYSAAKDWTEAKSKLDAIVEYIDRIQPLLEALLGANASRAEESQANMRAKLALLANAQNSEDRDEALRLLRESVAEEFACATEAKNLGLDPSIEMNRPYSLEEDLEQARENNRPNCEDKFIACDWFEIKDQLHAFDDKSKEYDQALRDKDPQATKIQRELVDRDFMTQLWKFRQQYVEKLINTLRKTYPNLIAKASGSTDLESDIDITFATSASGEDVIAAKEFNRVMLQKFRKPPGRTFDVNIYIREYGPGIKESFNEFHSLDPITDSNLDESTNEQTQKLTQVDMDIATLLKQRRFLSQEQFDELLNDVLSSMSPEQQKKTLHQYEEAESVYFGTLMEKIDGMETLLQRIIADDTEDEELKGRAQKAMALITILRAIDNREEFQRKVQETVEALENNFPALTMEATDDMYLSRMGVVRENEALVRTMSADEEKTLEIYREQAPVDKNGDKTISFEDWKQRKLEALRVQIKKDIITNIIFANEAYMSEGAIKHVVQTGQARDKTPEEKLQMVLAMPIVNLVQSTNEQLADFFKDMAHSTKDVRELREAGKGDEARRLEGEAYVHASKYIVRMLGAAYALSLKYESSDDEESLDIPWFTSEIDSSCLGGVSDDDDLSKKVQALEQCVDKLLYQLRKSGTIPQSVKGEIAVDEIKRIFKVDSIEDFTGKFRLLGVQLNNIVRQREDFIAEEAVEDEAVDDYLLLREETDAEKGATILNSCSLTPLKDRKSNLKEGLILLSIGEGEASDISQTWATVIESIKGYKGVEETHDLQIVLDNWKRAIIALKNATAKEALLRIHKAVLLQFDLKTLNIQTGSIAVQKILREADLVAKNARQFLYSKISSKLKEWVALKDGENRIRVTNKRASEKESLLLECTQKSNSLKGLKLRLIEVKGEIEGVESITKSLDEKIKILNNQRTRAIESKTKILTHPLFP